MINFTMLSQQIKIEWLIFREETNFGAWTHLMKTVIKRTLKSGEEPNLRGTDDYLYSSNHATSLPEIVVDIRKVKSIIFKKPQKVG
jgi:hypothetical protein